MTRTSEVRSGRSDADDVVVVGRGPIAAAVVARLGRSARGGATPVRALPQLPVDAPQDAVSGARAIVLVVDDADLASSTASPHDRRLAAVSGAQRAVEAARTAKVPQVVAVTSAMVHGAEPGRPVILDDDAPLPTPGEGTVGDLVAVEAVLARAARARGRGRPGIMVLRPAAVVGPGVDTLITRHFSAPRILAVRGVERPWQLVHVDDVAAAVEMAVEHGWTGAATVAADPVLTLAQVEKQSAMRRIELAAVTAFGTAERLHRVGVVSAPAAELAYVVYPWTVDPARLRSAGWVPEHDGEDCLAVLVAGVRGRVLVGSRFGGRDMALGAAGAAVALMGTAAVVRQARRHRYG